MSFDLSASTNGSHLPRSLLWRVLLLSIVCIFAVTKRTGGSTPSDQAVALAAQEKDTSAQNYYANAHSYLEEPMEQLIQQIPELKTMQSSHEGQVPPAILERTGEQVDEFFRNVIDLSAHEEITEEKLGGQGQVTERLQMEDSYLILRRGTEMFGSVNEYRMDPKGNPMEETGLRNGYFVTANFALTHFYFATAFQSDANFRYLGDQELGTRDTYVVAFAQKPDQATPFVVMTGQNGTRVKMLMQGIAWVDKKNFQIVVIRTDLLAPRPEIWLNRLTTTVTFGEVQLLDVGTPLWLPSDVKVEANFRVFDNQVGYYELNFRNEHHYSEYKSYRVSVKMLPEGLRGPVPVPARPMGESVQHYYANAHPYVEQSLDQLSTRLPELRKIQPAADSQELPVILEKTATNVDSFFRHIVDLIAKEKITQARLNGGGFSASEHVQDNYLILRRANGADAEIVEYRMDAKGNRMDHVGLDKGYLATSGFALTCNYFSSAFRAESNFRYLGDQKLGTRDTYVVAFAQKPDRASLFVMMAGRSGTSAQMLMQGIAWVDKSNFQIIRMRTDLLAPRPELALESQTTEVIFSKVQLLDVITPLWLPSEVKVNVKFRELDVEARRFDELSYRNVHHYSDYRRYRVSVHMVVPQ